MADDDLESLYNKHGEGTVKKAFWLQDTIFEEGLDGVGFMEAGEDRIQQQGPMLIKKAIEDEFKRDI